MILGRPASQISRRQVRPIHTSFLKAANPVPHPTAPGPPPKPPSADPTFVDDRVARKRKQAELLKEGQKLKTNPAKPATNLQKRFWKNVSVQQTENGYQVLLDSRPVRNATKDVLYVPSSKPQLAAAIAHEWDSLVSAQQALKQHYIPITALTSRAQDIEIADRNNDPSVRDALVKMVMGYLRTDTLLCWSPEKNMYDGDTENNASLDAAAEYDEQAPGSRPRADTLRSRQQRVAQPIMNYLITHIWPGVELKPALESSSILPTSQPEMTEHVVQGWVSGLPAYDLAGLERAVLASKSLCVATRLLTQWSPQFNVDTQDEPFNIEDAAEACSLEVSWQTQMWGEVEDTHDVDREDLRRQLGSVIVLVNGH